MCEAPRVLRRPTLILPRLPRHPHGAGAGASSWREAADAGAYSGGLGASRSLLTLNSTVAAKYVTELSTPRAGPPVADASFTHPCCTARAAFARPW
ncbi:hypothetical protein EON67_02400 [archaeon]|nr:MAG: hypothetical protein EON67_02400 [archaeon]